MKKDVEAMGVHVTETNWAPTATDLTNSALATKGADALMLVGYPAPEAQMGVVGHALLGDRPR